MRANILLFLVLAGCPEPTVTGAGGMVGRLVDAAGEPLVGVAIESLESRAITGPDGAFTVLYKPTEQYVHFRIGDTWYRRNYSSKDEGGLVEIRLPPSRDAGVTCGIPCDLTLEWDLGSGTRARASGRCEPGASLVLSKIPVLPAKGTCGGALVSDAGGGITVTGQPGQPDPGSSGG